MDGCVCVVHQDCRLAGRRIDDLDVVVTHRGWAWRSESWSGSWMDVVEADACTLDRSMQLRVVYWVGEYSMQSGKVVDRKTCSH